MEERQLKKFGFRFFSSEGRRDIDGGDRDRRQPLPLGAELPDRSRHLRELPRRGSAAPRHRLRRRRPGAGHRARARAAGCTASTGVPATSAHATEARWLVDACGRAGLLKRKLGLAEANAHDANAVWFRMQDRIAIDDWPGDRGLAGALRAAGALALDQPHGRRRLLGLADSAVLGLALGGHRRRREAASALDHEHLREGDGLARASTSRACSTRSRASADRLMDFAFFRNFSYGCKQVFSAPALGPHRRGGPVPRPVLFAGQRLHRHRQHLHLRAGRARPRRPAARGARADLRPDLPLVLREHARRSTPTSTRSSATPRCCRSR